MYSYQQQYQYPQYQQPQQQIYNQPIYISAFTPSARNTWEQIDAQFFIDGFPYRSMEAKERAVKGLNKPNNRRYRQNELKVKIPKLEIELETLKVKQMGCMDPMQHEFLNKKIKELISTIKQKKRHLLRLEKNMSAQEAIRNKKSNSSQ